MGIRKRDISSEEFRRLLARLDQNPELAWSKYDQLRLKLVSYFQSFGHYAEAEELADEALDRISKKPETYASHDLPILALGFARNMRKEMLKKTARTVRPLSQDDFPGKDQDPEVNIIHRIDKEQRIKCFLRCMRKLMPHERWLILQYFPDENCNVEDLRKRLAEMLGIEGGTLAKRVERLRKKLESCCGRCIEEIKMTFN
jgi:DNA-directed RNA polymerase specialized sigma24 family protein